MESPLACRAPLPAGHELVRRGDYDTGVNAMAQPQGFALLLMWNKEKRSYHMCNAVFSRQTTG